MDYGKYKNARNASWQCLLDYDIKELPVKVTEIIKRSENIKLFKNSDVNILQNGESGLTIAENGNFHIIYNDAESSYRCRFTIAHELGHIFLGHLLINKAQYRTFKTNDSTESSANVFARDLLAPACVLHELGVINANEISKLCNISMESATYREKRMRELETRNAWYLHPLERKVYKNFENFIRITKNTP